jgi:hypothetical protein
MDQNLYVQLWRVLKQIQGGRSLEMREKLCLLYVSFFFLRIAIFKMLPWQAVVGSLVFQECSIVQETAIQDFKT